jgi:hypothetical protein
MKYAAGYYSGCRGIAGSEQYGNSSTGNEEIWVKLTVPDLGAEVMTRLSFSEKAASYSIERLRALGWEGDDLTDLRGIDRNDVTICLKYEVYQGKEQMRVDIVTGGRFEVQAPMDDHAKRRFGAKFRDLARQTRPAAASAAAGDTNFPFGANAPTPQAQGRAKF